MAWSSEQRPLIRSLPVVRLVGNLGSFVDDGDALHRLGERLGVDADRGANGHRAVVLVPRTIGTASRVLAPSYVCPAEFPPIPFDSLGQRRDDGSALQARDWLRSMIREKNDALDLGSVIPNVLEKNVQLLHAVRKGTDFPHEIDAACTAVCFAHARQLAPWTTRGQRAQATNVRNCRDGSRARRMMLAMTPRSRNRFDPSSDKPFKLSRSRLELFLQCPRCFYMDRRLGVDRVHGPAFTLNTAVDALLKKEFDRYRTEQKPHPLMLKHGVDAVPFQHPDINRWRENFVGVQYHHAPTNFLVFGAVDDLWARPDGTLHVVDFKSTSTDKAISLDDEWKLAYKRQMEIYQWLLRQNGFTVADRGYFVYVNGDKSHDAFGGRLNFTANLIPYDGDSGWVEQALVVARNCLVADAPPAAADSCEWCAYVADVRAIAA